MAQVRDRKVQCATPAGLHRIAYREWGDPANERVLVCVHGLTRCARDFDRLAGRLSARWRVVCPDIAGRGESDRLADPRLYQIPTYVADMVTLIARLDIGRLAWLGTSMGGLIGLALAAQQDTPVSRLILNDAGPVVARASLERIAAYVGMAPPLPSLEAAEQLVRTVSAPFGPHSDAEWRFLTEIVVRPRPEGGYRMHYDPAIAVPFREAMPEGDLTLWPLWDAIRCPVFVLRGAESDLLTRATCEEMAARGPRATTHEFAGVGHAPTLMHEDQIAVVERLLEA